MLGLQVHELVIEDELDQAVFAWLFRQLFHLILSGGTQTLFCVEVGDKDKVGPGGGLVEEGEMINVVEMTVSEVKEYISR